MEAMVRSYTTYENERMTDRLKQWGGMAFLTSPTVNGGFWYGTRWSGSGLGFFSPLTGFDIRPPAPMVH
ncbi:hypothetical protein HanPI659440_Chr01g0011521 [Helianthus annuus]|nr:hypothetical protein HanIR_Chr01g0015261 [Helianthus annuus]KAJ0809151.1 hypothetical protein HanPI659440_Chr01g0011521 [Helianthus annuus]